MLEKGSQEVSLGEIIDNQLESCQDSSSLFMIPLLAEEESGSMSNSSSHYEIEQDVLERKGT